MEKLKYHTVLVISDNLFLINAFANLASAFKGLKVDYACTPNNLALLNNAATPVVINALNVKTDYEKLIGKYDLIFSLHCKQLFPAGLVTKVKCINVHPGYNPFNRGWFPQVFSILNNKPAGATIHEIDELLDHGAVIARREAKINSWETSLDVYNKVQLLEVELLKENMEAILCGTYKTMDPEQEGNVNLKKDFNDLCLLDMNKATTMGEAINYLRALTHGNYPNAFFVDSETGAKVYVKISLQKE